MNEDEEDDTIKNKKHRQLFNKKIHPYYNDYADEYDEEDEEEEDDYGY